MNDKFASPRWMGDLHHKQFDWPIVGRIAWWVLLLTPAVLCWAATKEDRRIRYGVFAAVALIVVFGMAADGGDDNSIATWIVVIGAASIVAELVIMGRGEFRRRRALRRTKAQASGPKVSPVAGGGSGLNQRARQAWKDDGSN